MGPRPYVHEHFPETQEGARIPSASLGIPDGVHTVVVDLAATNTTEQAEAVAAVIRFKELCDRADFVGYDQENNTADVTGSGHPGSTAWMQFCVLNSDLTVALRCKDKGCDHGKDRVGHCGRADQVYNMDGGTAFLFKGLAELGELPQNIVQGMKLTTLVGVGINGDLTNLRKSFPDQAQDLTVRVVEMSKRSFHRGTQVTRSLQAMLKDPDLIGKNQTLNVWKPVRQLRCCFGPFATSSSVPCDSTTPHPPVMCSHCSY